MTKTQMVNLIECIQNLNRTKVNKVDAKIVLIVPITIYPFIEYIAKVLYNYLPAATILPDRNWQNCTAVSKSTGSGTTIISESMLFLYMKK